MKITKLLSFALLALSISMVSCSGEDGTDGINGIDGVDGQDGINGQDGADGENGTDGQDGTDGVGFDEMTQFGAMTMTLSGTRPDGVAFEDTNTFKFTALEANSLLYNSVTIDDSDVDNTLYTFQVKRYLTAPDDVINSSSISFSLEFVNLGEPTEELLSGSFDIYSYAVVGDDNKFFQMYDLFENGGVGVSDFEFTDLVFDAADNNHLTFSYSFMATAAANDTDHELTVSGDVDVYLLEPIK